MTHPLRQLVRDHKRGVKRGIASICSANAYVIEAAVENAKKHDEYVLIEATANQVNQFGGYTGMKPADFAGFVSGIAEKCGFDTDRLLLGGDHLGPLTWTQMDEGEAMANAAELVRQYVLAGFTKIHIDTSMRLDGDPAYLSDGIIARRGASLSEAAEAAYAQRQRQDPDALAPVYVIGSEVPIPGGAQEEEDGLAVTRVEDFTATVETFREHYETLGLAEAWERVIAVVVQPGVEFGDATVHEYDREKAKKLSAAIGKYPGLVFEGHSTDYQTPVKLREMVEDGIAILKVGPAVTFAMREALFSLEMIERELLSDTGIHLSNLKHVLEHEMLKDPTHWHKHYHGSMDHLYLKRMYSYSDRSRYYWPSPAVASAVARLLENTAVVDIPAALLSQYMPVQYEKVRQHSLPNDPLSLLKDRIVNCLDAYAYGCGR